MKRIILAILVASLFALSAFAQTSRGTVSGTITDVNGAVVPGAEIKLINTGTSVERTASSTDDGFFRFDAVDLGIYTLKISAKGFGVVTRNNISVSANQTSSVDTKLQVGAQDAVVDIVAGTEQLQTEASVRGGNISEKTITELPIAGNPVALALTLPGVSSNRGGFGVGTFSVNGARGRSNNFLIDGTENNDISVAGQGFQITNQDAVQEVAVQTSNFDSEFGRAGGAVVNVITKSGTNKFGGTLAFEYDTSADDAITAAGSRNPVVLARKRPLSNTQFVPSATFGGPLFLPNFGEGGPSWNTGRDKNFFFVAYEETRFRQPGGSTTLIVPTAAGRARLATFGAGNPNVAAYLAATANTIAPIADRTAISLDNTSTGGVRGLVENGQFFRSFASTTKTRQFQLRTDHNLTPRDQLSFRFLSENSLSPKGGEVGFEGFDADSASKYYNFLISETHSFSSTITNELRVAYNRIDLSFPIADASGPAGTQPQINIAGLTSLGTSATFPQGRIANNYQVQDTVTFVLGKHTLRTGIDYLRQISTQTAPANIRGAITYNAGGNFTSLANFVDNFGGSLGTASRVFGSPKYNPTLHRFATFIHDRWKATNDLSLTFGIRYERFGTPFNSLFAPAFSGLFNVNATTRQGPYSQRNQIPLDKNNFSPSIGFAYSPSFNGGIGGFIFGEKKSVIRAGFNIGYDSFFNNIASNAVASSPNTIVTTNTSVVTGTDRGLPNFSSLLPTAAGIVLPTSAQTLIAPNLVNPYYQRWSLGFQRELPLKLFMDVSYVGSKGTKLFINEDANPLVRLELRSPAPAGYPVCTIGTNLTLANQILPLFPAFTLCPITGRLDNIQGGRTVRTNGGSSSYNAGQIQVTRRFSNSFQVSGAYTYSKNISNADEVFGIGIGSNATFAAIPAILGGERNERAVSSFDRTHRGSITYVVRSPFFDKQQGFIGKLLGGFQVSGITTFESGVPYTVFNGNDADGVGGGLDRPNFNPNGTPGVRAIPAIDPATGAIIRYFNPEITVPITAATPNGLATIDPNTAQFIVNPTYVPGLANSLVRIGNLGRNTERSKGINNFDMTFLKRTKISEKVSFETRAEFFNVLNHPQFGAALSTANSLTQGQFLRPINPTTSGGGRVVRYQIKLVF
jgi:Carboxypeptidase regulatory-like domain/TonB-dependent Receptor Plug Domain